MAQYVPVNRQRHGGKRWRRPAEFSFARADAILPLAGAELPGAARGMPIAFMARGTGYAVVAVLSLLPGRNMFLGPSGEWFGPYMPAVLRVHPFALRRREGADQLVLCIDEDGAGIGGLDAPGEDFFDANGELSPAVKTLSEVLAQLERNHAATGLAVAALAEAGVIRPWENKTAGDQQVLSGLHRIDEQALHALDDQVFLKLRRAGALPVAYAQLISMGQMAMFPTLARLQAQAAQARSMQPAQKAAALPESLDGLFGLSTDDIVRFK